jgi:cytochrome P450
MTAVQDAALSPDEVIGALFSSPQPDDPYPLYDRLRELAPVFPSATGMTFLTRYDDCAEAVRNPGLLMAGPQIARQDPRFESSSYLRAMAGMLIFTDPPAHTRLKRLISKAFTPRMVAGVRPAVESLVAGHLDRLAELGEFDLVAEMTDALPAQTICELVGVPLADHHLVVGWADDISTAASTPALPDHLLATANAATSAFHAYLDELIALRRREPRDDLLSRLIEAEEEGTRLDGEEMKSFVVNILAAGTETTTHLLSVGLHTLLRHPAQLAALRAEPGLLGATIDELLRYESPVQMAFVRVAAADLRIGGHPIAPGTIVAALTGAANHDPAVYPDPHRFEIRRSPGRVPLTFGTGAHFCIGAALARLQGEVALGALLRRFPRIEPAGEPVWRNSIVLRGVRSLPLRVRR